MKIGSCPRGTQSGLQGIAFMQIISDKVVSFTGSNMQEINAKKSLKEGKAPRDLEACPQ